MPAKYTNAFVLAGGVTNDSENTPLSVSGSVGVVSQNAASSVTIGRGARINGADVAVHSSSNNEGVAMGGYLDNFLGIALPNRDNARAVGATVIYQEFSGGSSVTVQEGSEIESDTNIRLQSDANVDAATIAASAGINSGGLTLSGIAAVTKAEGGNLVAIDDEAVLKAGTEAGNAIEALARRSDSLQTVAGGLNIGKSGSGGSNASVGAGVAVNLGGLTNAVELKDKQLLCGRRFGHSRQKVR